jgi:hypothetical protein
MDSQTREKLRLLALYLKHLPDSIPTVHASATEYGFDFLTCEDDDIADMGVVGAVNRQLEIRFGPRNNGPVILKEQGIGLEGVVDVLQSNIDRRAHLGEIMLLHKWLDDLIAAAVHAYSAADVPNMR